jgi:hypothetical protein
MKKLFAVLALVGVMTSCKSKKKDEKKPDETTVTTPPTDNTTPPPDVTPAGDVPKFADADVQKYVDDYTAFANGLIEAYKTKDMAKIGTLSQKATEWSSKTMEISKKLMASPEEAQKFSNYITKISTDLTEAAKSMMPTNK